MENSQPEDCDELNSSGEEVSLLRGELALPVSGGSRQPLGRYI
jgi:hypothetical protein